MFYFQQLIIYYDSVLGVKWKNTATASCLKKNANSSVSLKSKQILLFFSKTKKSNLDKVTLKAVTALFKMQTTVTA